MPKARAISNWPLGRLFYFKVKTFPSPCLHSKFRDTLVRKMQINRIKNSPNMPPNFPLCLVKSDHPCSLGRVAENSPPQREGEKKTVSSK
ncbi:hypothetical protein CEXT_40141 [Caerostris extrusa]|uniref:Uncharacterized protein n=1 Tax=Caerostris extrusa TaxID=172846 RepID=A0AAV4MUF3_CAEEX|nr:hypothetical protein CEXT_40141 [Caerostris extrusa]